MATRLTVDIDLPDAVQAELVWEAVYNLLQNRLASLDPDVTILNYDNTIEPVKD